jgi:hypothetical protein
VSTVGGVVLGTRLSRCAGTCGVDPRAKRRMTRWGWWHLKSVIDRGELYPRNGTELSPVRDGGAVLRRVLEPVCEDRWYGAVAECVQDHSLVRYDGVG